MNWKVWKRNALTPSLSCECRHMWSNWSAPETVGIKTTTFSLYGGGKNEFDCEGIKQERFCLNCNMYERRLVS